MGTHVLYLLFLSLVELNIIVDTVQMVRNFIYVKTGLREQEHLLIE